MDILEQDCDVLTPRKVVLHRQAACRNAKSLASEVVAALQLALSEFLTNQGIGSSRTSTRDIPELLRLLKLHLVLSQLDLTLSQELAQEGSHICLLKLMAIELQDDDLELVHELACEIASLYPNFPVNKSAPYSLQDIRQRLPIEFMTATGEPILLHQVVTERQSAQADVGFVLWPSAVVLARWLERNEHLLTAHTSHSAVSILELGAGCGLCGLVAAALTKPQLTSSSSPSSTSIILTDFNLTVLRNLEANMALNNLQSSCTVIGLDFYQQTGTIDDTSSSSSWTNTLGQLQPQVDIVLAADMICQQSDAFAAARTIVSVLRPGGVAYIVCADSHHRYGVQCFPEACQGVGLEIEVVEVDLEAEMQRNRRLQEDLEKSCGYVQGMNLHMFTVTKLNR